MGIATPDEIDPDDPPAAVINWLLERNVGTFSFPYTKAEKALDLLGVDMVVATHEVTDDPNGPHLGKFKRPERLVVVPAETKETNE